MREVYREVLKGPFKVLGHYADELREAASDFHFFCSIAKNTVPLLRKSPAFERFYFQYIKEKNTYLSMHAELEGKAPIELECVFSSLKEAVTKAGILNDKKIQQQLDAIEQVFIQKNRYAMPSYLDEAYNRLKTFLEELLNLGLLGVVQKYAIVVERGAVKPYIQRFIFAPSLIHLYELDDVWRWEKVQDAWVAWEYLSLVEWCWVTPFSFFDDKVEKYDDYQSRNTSIQLLSLHSYWVQIDKIKHHESQEQEGGLFRRALFNRYLKLILDAVILEQETTVSATPSALEKAEEAGEPYSIELRLDYTRLLLIVQWSQYGTPSMYTVHIYHDGKARQSFMANMLESPGASITIEGLGGSVAKYLGDAGLNNILGEVFVERLNTHTARLRAKTIMVGNLSALQRDKLKNFIRDLARIPFT